MQLRRTVSRNLARATTDTHSHFAQRPALLSDIVWMLVSAIVIFVPIVLSMTGKDAFRVPKDSLFLGGSLLVIALSASLMPFARIGKVAEHVPHSLACPLVALVVWSIVGTLTSTNRRISTVSLIWLMCVVAFLIAITILGRRRSIDALYLLFIPGVLNATIFLLQRLHLWNPFHFDSSIPPHQQYTALVGNPDDAGSFFVAPVIVALALLIVDKSRRMITIPVFALLAAALITGPLTSAAAGIAGMLTVLFVRSRRSGIIGGVLLLATVIVFVAAFKPLRERLSTIRSLAAAGDYAEATSGRVTPFAAALLMARDHPIVGVGPGCYRWEYFPYKLRVERIFPHLARQFSHSYNFGETHNDHLQGLAETGVVGYCLGMAVVIGMASASVWRSPASSDLRTVTGRLICMPLGVALCMLCLGHFPLHLAAPTIAFVFPAALAFSWLLPACGSTALHERSGFQPLRIVTGFVIAAAALGVAYLFAYEPYVSNRMKKVVETSTTATLNVADPYLVARSVRSNIPRIQGCANAWLPDVDCCMLLAANYRIIGRIDSAVVMYDRALRYERRPELYFNLADVQLAAADRRSAVANFAQAVRFNRDLLPDVPQEIRDEVATAAEQ